jgi:hypothetical protein
LLTRAQRRLFTGVFVFGVLLIVNTLYLMLAAHVLGIGSDPERLPLIYQAMLVLHIGLGVSGFAAAVCFIVPHFLRMFRHQGWNKWNGIGVALLTLSLLVSGFFILSAANSRQHHWVFVGHQAAAALLVGFYLAHRWYSHSAPSRRTSLATAFGLVLAVTAIWLAHAAETRLGGTAKPVLSNASTAPPAGTATPRLSSGDVPNPYVPFKPVGDPERTSPLFPSKATTATGGYLPTRILTHDDLPDLKKFQDETKARGFAPSYFLGAQTCERCHMDIVKQWSQSAHRFASFNNPFYRRAVEHTRETAGKEKSQFCGGCHDPAIMLAANMKKTIDPLTPESQAGLTCLACHAIDKIHDKTGNGNYNIHDDSESPYAFEFAKTGLGRVIHDYLMKAKPAVHKQRMLQPFFRESEFCMSCHKVNLDVHVNDYRWLRGQDEYDNWQNSGWNHSNPTTWYEPAAVSN